MVARTSETSRRGPARRSQVVEGDDDTRTAGGLHHLAGRLCLRSVVVFPVITGSTASERIYDGYPDVGLDMLNSRTFDGRIQLLEYAPRVLDGPPGTNAGA
jgi:hypothetical protein